MAHYDLHLSEVPLEFSLDIKLQALATKSVDLHSFEDELTLISKYADEYGPSPRTLTENEVKAGDEGVLGGEEKIGADLEVDIGEGMTPTVQKGGDVLPTVANGNDLGQGGPGQGNGESTLPPDQQQGGQPGDEPPIPSQSEGREEVPTIVNTQAHNEAAPGGEAGVVPEAVLTVVGNEIAPSSEVAAMAEEIKPVEEGISTSMKEALAAVEKAEKDEDVALLLERDSLVSQLASRCNISREECAFYLESTDWNLEDAIRIYNSFTG